jgi:hypothetical protein
MKVPTLVRQRFVNKEGYLTESAQLYLDELNTQMQNNLSNEGLVTPSLRTPQINTIADNSNPNTKPDGTLWFDTVTNHLKVKIDGVVLVIATAPEGDDFVLLE